jgi:hypothetical protein
MVRDGDGDEEVPTAGLIPVAFSMSLISCVRVGSSAEYSSW